MSSSKAVLRTGVFASFADQLQPLNKIDSADQKLEKLRNEIQQVKAAAYQEGHALGYRDGFDQAEQKGRLSGHDAGYQDGRAQFEDDHAGVLSEFEASLKVLLDQFQLASEVWFRAAEERYAELAIEVTKRAIASELELQPTAVMNIAKSVLADARSGTEIRIRVNPKDVNVLEAHKEELMATLAGIKGLEVTADRSVDAGVIIETADGIVDARVETFVERLEQRFQQEAA